MLRTRKLVSVVGATATVVGIAVVGAGGPAGASPAPAGYVPLPGSVAAFTTHTRATGVVAGSDRLTIQMWLRPQLAAAARFATAVSTPGSGRIAASGDHASLIRDGGLYAELYEMRAAPTAD